MIVGIKRVSSPSRRVYVGAQASDADPKGVGNKHSVDAEGIMVDREALKARVGGEAHLLGVVV